MQVMIIIQESLNNKFHFKVGQSSKRLFFSFNSNLLSIFFLNNIPLNTSFTFKLGHLLFQTGLIITDLCNYLLLYVLNRSALDTQSSFGRRYLTQLELSLYASLVTKLGESESGYCKLPLQPQEEILQKEALNRRHWKTTTNQADDIVRVLMAKFSEVGHTFGHTTSSKYYFFLKQTLCDIVLHTEVLISVTEFKPVQGSVCLSKELPSHLC